MESNRESTVRPSPDEARAALDDVNRVQADLADRLATPWWYHPWLGLIEALVVSSFALPVWLALPALVVALAGLGLLVRAYQRLTGLGMSRQYFALTREWSIALMVISLVAMGMVFLVDKPVVTAVAAVIVFGATVVMGRAADSVLRNRLRHGKRTR